MSFKRNILKFLWILLPACGLLDKEAITDQQLFEKAQKQSKRGYYIEAVQTILKLQHQFPYSPYKPQSDLLRADVFFDQREWEQARLAYKKFIDLYPKHKQIDYAYFRQILSWNHQIPTIATRDISLSQPALESIDYFFKQYPKSSYKTQVKKLQTEIYNRMAEKELRIAQFYFKRKKYKAVLKRLDIVIEKYPKSLWFNPAVLLAVQSADQLGGHALKSKYEKKARRL